MVVYFFFQAEDGIRDIGVTGVQTCALPIYKLGIIRALLRTYPGLPFVLIGDSGEEDPEIYHQAAREHPGRIRAVYIRDVTNAKRDAEVKAIAKEMRSLIQRRSFERMPKRNKADPAS